MILIKPSHKTLTEIDGIKILKSIEAAGRTCYKSESKITDQSAIKFVEGILKSGHESVIEHENISVRFICDRGVTHEIVRHRLAAYSQESTRYCNYKGGVTFIIPPWVDIKEGNYIRYYQKEDEVTEIWSRAMEYAETCYTTLIGNGWSPQQARSVLPNSLKTEIVMTANVREWRHVLKLRTSKAAHPQMRELMIPLLKEFQEKIPILFDDI
ncbi:MAG: FAD-dependent thymidylate synthase [Nitrosopumilales archaeon]|nr:MAG: FAD-dependent thymidylate synthase [Nitrosopumilales archaeon]